MKRRAAFTWGEISQNQLRLLTWWRPESPYHDFDGIIADGAIRSTKTLSLSIAFLEWAWNTFQDQTFGASGKTIKSFERNVLNQLKQVALGRGYTFKHNKTDSNIVFTKGDNTVTIYIFGGKDEASQDLVQGITLAGFLFDEVALQPESFVNQAIARCSVDGRKLWYNCNPAGPMHWFKVKFVDRAKDLNLYHIHMTMDDNLTLSERIKDGYRKMYTGVFYQRYILGLWVLAEGIIYDMFDMDKHIEYDDNKYKHYAVGVDVGTANPTAFVKVGWNNLDNIETVKEYYHCGRTESKQKTDSQYADDLEDFCDGNKHMTIILDPSALSFKTELRSRGFTNVRDANNSVVDGIRFVSSLLHDGKLKFNEKCTNLLKEICAYIWDEKAQNRGEDKPVKDNDHVLDALRYVLFTLFGKQQINGGQEFRL